MPNELVECSTSITLEEIDQARNHFLSLDTNPEFSASHSFKPFIPRNLTDASHVWIRKNNITTLSPRYSGPYPLLKIEGNVAFILIDNTQQTISLSRIKPAFLIHDDPQSGDSIPTDYDNLINRHIPDNQINTNTQFYTHTQNTNTNSQSHSNCENSTTNSPTYSYINNENLLTSLTSQISPDSSDHQFSSDIDETQSLDTHNNNLTPTPILRNRTTRRTTDPTRHIKWKRNSISQRLQRLRPL